MPLHTPRVFNPDDYLQTPEGRVYTDERNAAAWERIYSELEALFWSDRNPNARGRVPRGYRGYKCRRRRVTRVAPVRRVKFSDAQLPHRLLFRPAVVADFIDIAR